ncbi:MAG: DUF6893 family small protein [Bryobacteraceae bacterium]
MFKIAGIAAAVMMAAGLMMNWADIKRYMKIERM